MTSSATSRGSTSAAGPAFTGGPSLEALGRLHGPGAAAARSNASTPASAGQPTSIPRPPFHFKTRILLPGAFLILFAAVAIYVAWDTLLPAAPVRVVPATFVATGATAPGGPGHGEGTGAGAAHAAPGAAIVQAPGWVEPDPFPVAVSALTDGVVKELSVLEGQSVSAGQVVARLVDDDARIAVSRADGELRRQTAIRDAAQQRWDHPYDRTSAVETAEAGVAEASASLTMLASQIEAESAKAEELRYESRRVDQALKERAATPLEAVVAQQRLSAQEAMLAATRANQGVLEAKLAKATAERAAAVEARTLRIEESSALAEAKAAVAAAEAARDEAVLRLGRMEIRAPQAGVVMDRLVAPGSKLMLGMDHPESATVVKLFDPAHLQVRVDVPLADAGKIFTGQRAEVVVGVLPDRRFGGEVTRVVNAADVAKNTQQFKVRIDDPARELKPEMLARVKFLGNPSQTGGAGASNSGAVFVPSALRQHSDGDGGHATVWVVEQGRAVRREVRFGEATKAGWIQVVEGINVGDQVIAPGSPLTDGQRVHVVGEWTDADVQSDGQNSAAASSPLNSKPGGGNGVH